MASSRSINRFEKEFLVFKEEQEALFQILSERINQQDQKIKMLDKLCKDSQEISLLKRAAQFEALGSTRSDPLPEGYQGDDKEEHGADILKDLLVLQLIAEKYPRQFEGLCKKFENYYGVFFHHKDLIEQAPEEIIQTFNIKMDRRFSVKWKRHEDLQKHSDVICDLIIKKWLDSVLPPKMEYPADEIEEAFGELNDLEFVEF